MTRPQEDYSDVLRSGPREPGPVWESPKIVFLPWLLECPTLEELETIASTAAEHHGHDVELNWTSPGSTNHLRLIARNTSEDAVANWLLKEVEGKEMTMHWSESTGDLAMICEIVSKLSAALIRSVARQAEVEAAEVLCEEDDDFHFECADDDSTENSEDLDDYTRELAFLGEAKTGVQVLSDQLINPVTGLRSYSALLKFLENEYNRYEAFNVPVSLIVFDITHAMGHSIPVQAVATTALRINLIKRATDVAGHFEEHDYAIVLPNTQRPMAAQMANKMLQIMTAAPLAPGLDKSNLKFSFGIASLPDDGDNIESLVRAAKSAKTKARERIA